MKIRDVDPKICKRRIIGVSYSGGGNRGIVHVGALRAFLEKKVVPTHVVGVSAGAFVAAFHAYDPHTFNSFTDLKILFSFMNKAFIGLSPWQVALRFLTKAGGVESLGDSKKIEQTLEKHLPFRNFSDLKATLSIGATNIETGQDHWFKEGPMIPALLASSATPGIFPPVRIGDNVYMDGGVTDNLPLFELAKEGCGLIYAINAGYSGQSKRKPKNFIENIINARDIAQYQTTRYETELISCLYPNIDIISVNIKAGLGLAPYDFTPEKIEVVLEESYKNTLLKLGSTKFANNQRML